MLSGKGGGQPGGQSGGRRPDNAGPSRAGHGVAALKIEEPLEFDQDRVVELVVAHGEEGAQKIVDAGLREIATLTSQLVHDLHQLDPKKDADPCQLCDQIDLVAHRIGLMLCCQVVGDVKRCIKTGNDTAKTAVLHRLVRLASRAMRQSWDLCEHWT